MENHKLFLGVLLVCLAAACSDDHLPSDSGATSSSASSSSSSSGAGGAGGGGAGGAGGGGGDACFPNPMTHVEIINACTDAEKVDKDVSLPLLNADGSLPPLP